MNVNSEVQSMWKEVVVTCFKILPQHFHGGIGKGTRSLSLLPVSGRD